MATIRRLESELTGKITYRAQVRVKAHPPESQTFSTRKKAESWRRHWNPPSKTGGISRNASPAARFSLNS
jgi:hypothetical protein